MCLCSCVSEVWKKKATVVDDKIVIQHQICLTATIDHRYVDGAQMAKMAKRLKAILEDPQLLDGSQDATAVVSNNKPERKADN